jgi:hypothetical protein
LKKEIKDNGYNECLKVEKREKNKSKQVKI